jgi:hypothetical protein
MVSAGLRVRVRTERGAESGAGRLGVEVLTDDDEDAVGVGQIRALPGLLGDIDVRAHGLHTEPGLDGGPASTSTVPLTR